MLELISRNFSAENQWKLIKPLDTRYNWNILMRVAASSAVILTTLLDSFQQDQDVFTADRVRELFLGKGNFGRNILYDSIRPEFSFDSAAAHNNI